MTECDTSTEELFLILYCIVDDLYPEVAPDWVRFRRGTDQMGMTDPEIITLSTGAGRSLPVGWRRVFGVRDRLGWTQTEFALFLGVTHSVPAVWESPESGDKMLGGAIRAALLALDLSSDPGRPDYREPGVGWKTLKTSGLQAFYDETLEPRIGPPRSSP